jgi:hypothetical protein
VRPTVTGIASPTPNPSPATVLTLRNYSSGGSIWFNDCSNDMPAGGSCLPIADAAPYSSGTSPYQMQAGTQSPNKCPGDGKGAYAILHEAFDWSYSPGASPLNVAIRWFAYSQPSAGGPFSPYDTGNSQGTYSYTLSTSGGSHTPQKAPSDPVGFNLWFIAGSNYDAYWSASWTDSRGAQQFRSPSPFYWRC